MKVEKFLPIGTIVLLNGATKKIMITGFYVVNDSNKAYDYCGCLYPEGYLSSDKCLMFNHDQIYKIIYLGYSDDEDKKYRDEIKRFVDNKE
ncbi:MAG: DUF4176 domain-containing protein [Bacilli bacterium]|nr:DUF4176 domain-containing protein [Bacilli bacterium]